MQHIHKHTQIETFDFFQVKNIEKENKTSKYSPVLLYLVIRFFGGGVISGVVGCDQVEN